MVLVLVNHLENPITQESIRLQPKQPHTVPKLLFGHLLYIVVSQLSLILFIQFYLQLQLLILGPPLLLLRLVRPFLHLPLPLTRVPSSALTLLYGPHDLPHHLNLTLFLITLLLAAPTATLLILFRWLWLGLLTLSVHAVFGLRLLLLYIFALAIYQDPDAVLGKPLLEVIQVLLCESGLVDVRLYTEWPLLSLVKNGLCRQLPALLFLLFLGRRLVRGALVEEGVRDWLEGQFPFGGWQLLLLF